ncbi:serine hydrolase domain-containing protein [Bhargavaea beijingensis]|uniref:Class A beta-lactamase-related serine hydrolase n=1 Tax=Bhargavaea beijingensis TaxID=426756 RepID=A0ABX9ZCI2_9BACL|nr:serine hydrolase domain-containing protein [Bhargavaea beijingensis]MCW1929136.1 beta-lactamase family protein [Bhargavaea beijingensis]RSK30992.1 class A beta-lactamase-related serine hydrolase [Bhargavaea beijingensis]
MKWNAFEQFAEKLRVEEGIPGMAVGVARNGAPLFVNGFGNIDVEGATKVTPDTVFGTASVTKSFTALAVHILAAEGKLSVADPVIEHLPEAGTIPVLRSTTIRHLLSHTTGMPPVRRREELTEFGEHIRYLESLELNPIGPPGGQISYSNDAFLLLGAVIEKAAGMDYREFIMERIVRPAGMNRTSFTPPEQGEETNTAVQYTEDLQPADWPGLGNYAVGGGIRSTVNDLLVYGRLYTDQAFRKSVLGNVDPAGMQELVAEVDETSFYGHGLMLTPDFGGSVLVHHGGGQPGVSSSFGFLPDQGVTVAVLTNRTGVSAEKLMKGAVCTVLGKSSEEAAVSLPNLAQSPGERMSFAGFYGNEEDPDGFRIHAERNNLTLTSGGRVDELHPAGPGRFVNGRTGKRIRFEIGSRGEMTAFTGLRIYWRT